VRSWWIDGVKAKRPYPMIVPISLEATQTKNRLAASWSGPHWPESCAFGCEAALEAAMGNHTAISVRDGTALSRYREAASIFR
jgi:hypothetical protein